MARQTNPPQPEQGVPAEQALVTPMVRPEVLLALQQTQASQAINNECAAIRQELGTLRGELNAIKATVDSNSDKIDSLKTVHTRIIAGAAVAGALFGLVWYLLKDDFETLREMARDQQYIEANPDSDKKPGSKLPKP